MDGVEVGQHAAQPALFNVGHARAAGFFSHDIARLALGADKQNGAAVGGHLTREFLRFLEHRQRLFQVDDVNLVAMAEDERSHLGVPEARLVSEVDAGFQHFTHGDGHVFFLKVGS